jgi:hypothetical protein
VVRKHAAEVSVREERIDELSPGFPWRRRSSPPSASGRSARLQHGNDLRVARFSRRQRRRIVQHVRQHVERGIDAARPAFPSPPRDSGPFGSDFQLTVFIVPSNSATRYIVI